MSFSARLREMLMGDRASLDIPFSRDDSHVFLPWIIGFMVLLCALVLALGITINHTIANGRSNYDNLFTVQVPYQSQGMETSVRKIVAELKKLQGIKTVTPLSTKEVKSLIAPWLGSGAVLDMLPLPALIEVQLSQDQDKPIHFGRLRQRLANLVPDVQVEHYQEWVLRYTYFTRAIQGLAFLLGALIITTTMAMIILATRTSLRLHGKTVLLLHSIGATDDYIARQFQTNACLSALKGALAGVLTAALLFGVLVYLASGLQGAFLPVMQFSPSHIMMLLALPLVTGLTAWLASRVTVLSMLRAHI